MLNRWMHAGIEPSPSKKLVATFANGNKNPKPNTMPPSKNSPDKTRVLERLKIENSFSKIQNSVILASGKVAPATKLPNSKSPIAIKL